GAAHVADDLGAVSDAHRAARRDVAGEGAVDDDGVGVDVAFDRAAAVDDEIAFDRDVAFDRSFDAQAAVAADAPAHLEPAREHGLAVARRCAFRGGLRSRHFARTLPI